MSKALFSILTLYNHSDEVFSHFYVPETVEVDGEITPTGIDAELVRDNILLECAELEFIYPSPELARFAIGKWCDKCSPIWEKLAYTVAVKYNPLDNYDRNDDFTVTNTGKVYTNEDSKSANVSNVTQTEDVYGFNSSSPQTANKTTTATAVDGSNKETNYTHDTADRNSNYTENDLTERNTGRSHGNIGVTSTQQLIEQERGVAEFNLCDYITEDFKRRFCILVY